MRLSILAILGGLVLVPGVLASQGSGDERAVREVIERAYVRGVFVDRDPAAVRAGFHPAFVMSVLAGEEVIAATLDMWLGRMHLDGVRSSDTVRHVFDRVDITDRTATVKLRLWINGTHTYTDYMSLYRFADGWRIVNKVFAEHD